MSAVGRDEKLLKKGSIKMKAFDLTGKVAIVTGSTSGIGIGVARVLARQGAQVIVTGRREARGAEVVKEIEAEGGKAAYHKLDIMQEDSIKALIEDTVKTYGKLDIVVNNAANVNAEDGNVADLKAEQWDEMLTSDLKSVFLVSKYAIKEMQKQQKGSIINIGSTAGVAGNLGWSAYGPAKAGVANLTKNIAYQYGKENIRCNCIQPGLIVTPQNDANVPDWYKQIYLDEIEVNRYGCPEDIGYMALFFASDEAEFVTSQIVTVDGGMMSHAPMYTALRKMMEASQA